MRGLAEMFNVNYFICSQTNPHIVPALNIKRHLNRTFADLLEGEFKHRCAPWLATPIAWLSLRKGHRYCMWTGHRYCRCLCVMEGAPCRSGATAASPNRPICLRACFLPVPDGGVPSIC